MSHPAAPRRNAVLPSVNSTIANRWSPRGFDARHELTDEMVDTLLDAARWAPSASNTQPWSFLVAHRGTPEHAQLVETLMSSNQTWAPDASALFVGIVEEEREGIPLPWAKHDLGQATAFLLLQATTMGLHTHQMGGFEADQLAEAFQIEAPFSPQVVIAVGRHDSSDAVPAEIRLKDQAPRERKSLADMHFQSEA